MNAKSVKKLTITGLGVLFISLVFWGGMLVAYQSSGYPDTLLVVSILGLAWLVSARLWVSVVYSKNKKGYIYMGRHEYKI